MNFKFDFEIDYQNDAINSVVNLFKGQSYTKDYINPKGQTSFKNKPSNDDEYLRKGISNYLIIDDNTILKNLQEVQKYNGISESLTLDKKVFDIEMETGVGKTYVYLKTIFELNKKYGFTKFIIVVPSIAIKEGVYKTIEITKEHFKGNYDDLTFNPFIYNPKKLNEINDFLYKPNIQIMIINIDSFNREFRDKTKESNIIHREQDRLKGYKPIEFIQQTNPIVIIDEPQSVLGANKSNKSYKAIPSLNPLFILRYSATHRQTQNLVYKLDAVDAHNLNLVKHIEVAGFESSNYCDGPYIKAVKIKYVNKKTKAEIEVDVINNSTTRKKITVTSGENLVELTNNEIYDGYRIEEIVCDEDNNIKYIDFSSKGQLHEGESIGDVDNIKMKTAQIRQTIEKHLDKEKKFVLLFKKILECKLVFPKFICKSGKDLIEKILVTNPDIRITIPEIKKHPFFKGIDWNLLEKRKVLMGLHNLHGAADSPGRAACMGLTIHCRSVPGVTVKAQILRHKLNI